MDRRERIPDPLEALRAAMDGRLAEVWTALPGIVQSFDPQAMTVAVQPSVKGVLTASDGTTRTVPLPLLVDVPVVFPSGGGFTLTFPVREGDECLAVLASRCIDAWWQSGGVQEPLEPRMHNLSDAFAFVGPFSQPRTLPDVSTEDVELRTDDGQAHVAIKPDLTIEARNPAASVTLTPGGEVNAEADTRISLRAPTVDISADAFNLQGLTGAAVAAVLSAAMTLIGDMAQTGGITSTGDHVAGGISQTGHVHSGVTPGSSNTGGPQ